MMQGRVQATGTGATRPPDGRLVASLREAVLQATRGTFGAICGAEPTHQGDGQDPVACDGIIGIISFVGDAAWSMMLGLPRATATALAAKFAGFTIDFESADMGDVVGELANVLAGDVSARLDARRIRAQLSLPTVARGTGVEPLAPEGQAGLLLRFTCPQGDFWVWLATAGGEPPKSRQAGA